MEMFIMSFEMMSCMFFLEILLPLLKTLGHHWVGSLPWRNPPAKPPGWLCGEFRDELYAEKVRHWRFGVSFTHLGFPKIPREGFQETKRKTWKNSKYLKHIHVMDIDMDIDRHRFFLSIRIYVS